MTRSAAIIDRGLDTMVLIALVLNLVLFGYHYTNPPQCACAVGEARP